MASRDFGVVFDIDGVLLRGEDPIPGSREAVLKVRVEHKRRNELSAQINQSQKLDLDG